MPESPPSENRTPIHDAEPGLTTGFGALGYRNFRLYFSGHTISLVGWSMHSVALPWLVLLLTDSPFYVGLVGMLGTLPILLFSLYGGVVADRFPRRRVLLVTQSTAMLIALLLAAIVLTNRVTLAHVMIVATLLGLTAAFDIPGRQAFVGELVGKRDLMSAVALNSVSFNSSRIVGPGVAGIIIGVAGVGVCFLINGISYLALIGALLVMRLAPQPGRGGGGGGGGHTGRSTVWEGLAYVMHDRNMRTLVLTIAIASVFGLPYHVLLPVLARNVMGLGATEFGWMVSASAGGAVVAALGLATLGRRIPKGRVVTLAAPLFGIAVASLGVTRTLGALLPLLVVTGFFQVVLTATTNTMLQSLVRNELRGRVMAVYALAFLGLLPLGTLVAGIVAERWGAASWLTGSGLICTGLALMAPRMAPSLRAIG